MATIRQEKGEKYLVLKRKYYPQFDDDEEPRTAHPSAVNDIRGNLEPFVMKIFLILNKLELITKPYFFIQRSIIILRSTSPEQVTAHRF